MVHEYSLKYHVQNILLVTMFYIGALALVKFASGPIEQIFNDNIAFASLLFLPHGVRVVATVVFGPIKSFIYLFVAANLSMLFSPFSADLPVLLKLAQALVGAASAPIAFKFLSLAIGHEIVFLKKVNFKSWRILLIGIAASSVINSLLQSTLVEYSQMQPLTMSLVFSYLIGDMLGAVTVIYTTYLFYERLSRSSSS